MLVSTNVLSFMPLVSADANHTTQMEPLVEQRRGLALSSFVSFFLSDQNLNLFGQETANRGTTAGSKNLCLANGLRGKTNCNILLSHNRRCTQYTCSTYYT